MLAEYKSVEHNYPYHTRSIVPPTILKDLDGIFESVKNIHTYNFLLYDPSQEKGQKVSGVLRKKASNAIVKLKRQIMALDENLILMEESLKCLTLTLG
jgi:hypothetical protein